MGCTSEAEKEKDKPNCLLEVVCFEKKVRALHGMLCWKGLDVVMRERGRQHLTYRGRPLLLIIQKQLPLKIYATAMGKVT